MKPFILLSAIAALTLSTAWSQQRVRLVNGTVLEDVTITSVRADGPVIQPNRPGASATMYYWRMIVPEDKVWIEKLGSDQGDLRKMQGLRTAFRIKTRQNTGTIVLADYQIGKLIEGKGPAYFEWSAWSDEPVAITGLGDLIDGASWEGWLYPAGTHRYETVLGAVKTVALFAASPEKALKLTREYFAAQKAAE